MSRLVRAMREEGQLLAAQGLRRPWGYTAGDVELINWLLCRVLRMNGVETARAAFLLTEMSTDMLAPDLQAVFWPGVPK